MSEIFPEIRDPLWVIMTCECRLKIDELIEVTNRKICPKHPEGRIVSKEFLCVKCGEVFTTSKQVSSALYCPICRLEQLKKKNRKRWKKNYSAEAKKNPQKKKITTIDYIEASVEMAFCKKRSECTRKYTGKYLPCLDCEHYKNPNMINSL